MKKFVASLIGLLIVLFSQPAAAQAQETIDTTAVQGSYLPLVAKQMFPETPSLDAISNPEGDGDYSVNWVKTNYAERYILQAATDVTFTGSTIVYEGPNLSHTVSAQPTGTYFYRVKAANRMGDGNWSDPKSVTVLPPRIFPSRADASLLQGVPDLNDGTDGTMWVGYQHCNRAKISRGVMKFDLANIPVGTAIAQARLHFYLYGSCDLANRAHTITVYSVTEAWEENSITWNTRPNFGEAYGSTSVQSRSWGWYTVDVTGLVSQWISGTLPNNGLLLRGPESAGNDSALLELLTRNAAAAYTPYLEITYPGMVEVSTAPNSPIVQFLVPVESTKSLLGLASDIANSSFVWSQQASLVDEARR
jgi:hypothetical protein